MKFTPLKAQGGVKFGTLEFVKDPGAGGQVVVSRLDGNHRLWFADGHEKGMEPVSRPVSFCMLMLEDGSAQATAEASYKQLSNQQHCVKIVALLYCVH